MSATPQLKVFNPQDQYVASCKHAEDAACLMAFYGKGATIRNGHARRHIVYEEGIDGNAAESYDAVAAIVYNRITPASLVGTLLTARPRIGGDDGPQS